MGSKTTRTCASALKLTAASAAPSTLPVATCVMSERMPWIPPKSASNDASGSSTKWPGFAGASGVASGVVAVS
eukprot:CAMPEP_0206319842 /NCGR_PEP_ID=MMETSP0106_2-20121207/17987_1 /ASSEMBLY_ACC=CAM_ASM_000206 /TAXON_ID=81532 /ORGANISM="Acanthoeca-like sp., Strain 10tr" /LENGTH=72 /DNA_ID=CAMNT_0053751733 /DNA_START=59 /DNA_END=277 /DNA_ORIENTATION=+